MKGTTVSDTQKKSLKTENRASDFTENTENTENTPDYAVLDQIYQKKQKPPNLIKCKDGAVRDYANVGKKSVWEEKKLWRKLDTLVDMVSSGAENYKIAEALDIPVTQFYRLRRTNDAFRQAYEKGMEARSFRLEEALFRRAEGFRGQEIKKEVDAEGNITKQTITDKEYVPDTTALIFALKNVMPDKYKDRVEQTITHNISVDSLNVASTEQLLQMVAEKRLSSAIDVDFTEIGEENDENPAETQSDQQDSGLLT